MPDALTDSAPPRATLSTARSVAKGESNVHSQKNFKIAVASTLALAVLAAGAATAGTGDVTLVSITANGLQAAGDSNLRHGGGAVSAGGRFIVFHSNRPSLVRQDDNGARDVFLRDQALGTTVRISTAFDGRAADAYSINPAISTDGRFVSFFSPATNLVRDDANGSGDIFVWDREAGRIELASIGSVERQANDASLESAISGDGRYVVFTSFASNLARLDTNGRSDVFLRDRQGGYTERVSVDSEGREANGYSWQPCVSDDGRYVAFYSTASNLVPGDTGDRADVFVRDRQTRQTRRVSVAADGTPANGYSVQPAMSSNGRFVAFASDATNLVAGDTNRRVDVFVKDLQTGTVERVSVGPDGRQGNGGSDEPSISADGRFVSFESFASNLVAGDTNAMLDVFLHDRATGHTRRVSVGSEGTQANAANWTPSLSADGRYLAFRSDADNLTGLDFNASSDVYVKDLGPTGSDGVAFTIKPEALDFGTQPVGSSTTANFWLRNKASAPLIIDSIELRGEDAGAFALAGNTCGGVVAPADVCRISVAFRPDAIGTASAALVLRAAGGIVRTRGLIGEGAP
jgi:Tol biopolymer transport system component